MKRAADSIFYFGFWVLVCGISLLFFPAFCLGRAGIELPDYLVVRLFGLVLVYLSIYYFVAGRNPSFRPFYIATVFTRASALLIAALFTILGMAKPQVIGFTVVDALGAIWTAVALKLDSRDKDSSL